MIFLSPISLDTVSFSGGTADKFVRSYATQGVSPVAVFADPRTRFKSLLGVPRGKVKPSTIASSIGLDAPGSTFGLSSKELPVGFLMRARYDEYQESFQKPAKVSAGIGQLIVDGKTSCWVRIEDLMGLQLSKRLQCHWLYRTAYVAVSPGSFDESTLLHTIADALGAKWSEKPDGYHIDFEAKSHRLRALATYRNLNWSLSIADLSGRKEIYMKAAELADDSTWAQAFSEAGGSVSQMSDNATKVLAPLGLKVLASLTENLQKTNQMESFRVIRGYIERIDPQSPVRLEIKSDGNHGVDFRLLDGRSWFGI